MSGPPTFALALNIALDPEHPLRKQYPQLDHLPDADAIYWELQGIHETTSAQPPPLAEDEMLARTDTLMSDDSRARHRSRSGWEQSLDPRARWQHSIRGLLPGTIFAILLALAAVGLYLYVSPIFGVVVGILATLNMIVAVNHWVRLVSR